MCGIRRSSSIAAIESERSDSASGALSAATGSKPARRSTWTSAAQIAGSSSTMSTRGLPGVRTQSRIGDPGADVACEPIVRFIEIRARRDPCREPCDELFGPHSVARAARCHADAPLHGLGEGVGIGEADVIGDRLERVCGFAEERIAAEQPCAAYEFARRDEARALHVPVERPARDTGGG